MSPPPTNPPFWAGSCLLEPTLTTPSHSECQRGELQCTSQGCQGNWTEETSCPSFSRTRVGGWISAQDFGGGGFLPSTGWEWDLERSFLGLGQSQTNQDGWSPYSSSPVSGTFWSQQEPLVPHPLWSLGLVGGVPGKDAHKPPFLGLLPLSGWSEWSPCGPCLPLGLLAPASRAALEERWPQDTAGLSPTSAPTLASEQHRHRLCLDPETGRPWAGDPDLCTVPLSQQRLCPDPGACQGDGGGGPRGDGARGGGATWGWGWAGSGKGRGLAG